jgi:biotin-(acetyl-CoA carboxylase) ligase
MVRRAFLKVLGPLYDSWRRDGFAAVHPLVAACDLLKGKRVSVRQTDSDASPLAGPCGGIQRDGTLLVGDTPVYAGEAHVTGVQG